MATSENTVQQQIAEDDSRAHDFGRGQPFKYTRNKSKGFGQILQDYLDSANERWNKLEPWQQKAIIATAVIGLVVGGIFTFGAAPAVAALATSVGGLIATYGGMAISAIGAGLSVAGSFIGSVATATFNLATSSTLTAVTSLILSALVVGGIGYGAFTCFTNSNDKQNKMTLQSNLDVGVRGAGEQNRPKRLTSIADGLTAVVNDDTYKIDDKRRHSTGNMDSSVAGLDLLKRDSEQGRPTELAAHFQGSVSKDLGKIRDSLIAVVDEGRLQRRYSEGDMTSVVNLNFFKPEQQGGKRQENEELDVRSDRSSIDSLTVTL